MHWKEFPRRAPPRLWSAASILEPAAIIKKMAGGARRNDDRQFPGFAIERVVAAVGPIVPRNLRITDLCRIGIYCPLTIIDFDLPGGTAGRIGAGDRDLVPVRSEERRVGKECRSGWWA